MLLRSEMDLDKCGHHSLINHKMQQTIGTSVRFVDDGKFIVIIMCMVSNK